MTTIVERVDCISHNKFAAYIQDGVVRYRLVVSDELFRTLTDNVSAIVIERCEKDAVGGDRWADIADDSDKQNSSLRRRLIARTLFALTRSYHHIIDEKPVPPTNDEKPVPPMNEWLGPARRDI